MHDLVRGVPPALDLDAERALQALLVTLAGERLVRSAHDCSDGGLAVTRRRVLLRHERHRRRGFDRPPNRSLAIRGVNTAAALFGESASRVVISAVPDDVTRILERAAAARVPARVIGQTGGNRLRIAVGGEIVIDLSVDDAERVWSTAIEQYFVKRVA